MSALPIAVSGRRSRLLTLAGYYSFILIGWNTVVLPSLIRSIEHDFAQNDAGFALLYLCKSVLYAIGAFSGGFLTERFGRRAVLLAGTFLPVAGLLGSALAPSWAIFLPVSVLASWGGGVIDGGINGLFLDLFREARGAALTFLHLFFSIGALVAPFVIGLLVSAGMSWRVVLVMTAIGFAVLLPPLAIAPVPAGHRETFPATAAGHPLGPFSPTERSLLPFIALAAGIALYTGAEIGVSSWVVKMLSSTPLATATGILSLFWTGLAAGRLLSRWVAERLDYTAFTAGCFILASAALAGAVLAPWLALAAVLFTAAGLFYGPIYPMIMALGGSIYPHRLAALSGSLTTAGGAGVIIYPPLMGALAASIGLRAGMMGAALLGIPAVMAIVMARRLAISPSVADPPSRPPPDRR